MAPPEDVVAPWGSILEASLGFVVEVLVFLSPLRPFTPIIAGTILNVLDPCTEGALQIGQKGSSKSHLTVSVAYNRVLRVFVQQGNNFDWSWHYHRERRVRIEYGLEEGVERRLRPVKKEKGPFCVPFPDEHHSSSSVPAL